MVVTPESTPTPSTCILTLSGITIDLLDPRPEDIRIGDIAAHLSKINRWVGATALPYSVAQHSEFVSRQLERRFAQYGLLHDAHEAYLGDISSPCAAAIGALSMAASPAPGPAKAAIAELKRRMDQAIFLRFGLEFPMPPPVAIAVRLADMRALTTERRDLLGVHHGAAGGAPALPPPFPDAIKPANWAKAQDMFMARFEALFGGGYS